MEQEQQEIVVAYNFGGIQMTYYNIFTQVIVFSIVLLLSGCVVHKEQNNRDKYVLLEPISIAYMEYALQYQDLTGFIDGVEKRYSEDNHNLKDYLSRLRKINDIHNKLTPCVFSDKQEWLEFCELVKKQKYTPYFYIEEMQENKTDKQSAQRRIGIILFDAAGKEIKNYIIEEQRITRESYIPSKQEKMNN